ncbi:MAG: 16S rRNA (guanine(527)-N(7))-methyltransferase RsmG [Armatimonas sp.]
MTDDETRRFCETLSAACEALGIAITEEQVALCARHAALVLETNTHTNLTRITEPEAMALKHYADSLTAFLVLPKLARGASVCDVGTGAGYPGVPMKILRPDLKLTLLDSLNKRVVFLDESCRALGLENVTCRHARAEEVKDARFDVVAARAVAALPKLLPWITRLLKPGGRLVLLKGPDMTAELREATPIAKKFGLQLQEAKEINLPDPENSGRTLIVYGTVPTR